MDASISAPIPSLDAARDERAFGVVSLGVSFGDEFGGESRALLAGEHGEVRVVANKPRSGLFRELEVGIGARLALERRPRVWYQVP